MPLTKKFISKAKKVWELKNIHLKKLLGQTGKLKLDAIQISTIRTEYSKTYNALDTIFIVKFIILNDFIIKPERLKTMNYSLISRRYNKEQ